MKRENVINNKNTVKVEGDGLSDYEAFYQHLLEWGLNPRRMKSGDLRADCFACDLEPRDHMIYQAPSHLILTKGRGKDLLFFRYIENWQIDYRMGRARKVPKSLQKKYVLLPPIPTL